MINAELRIAQTADDAVLIGIGGVWNIDAPPLLSVDELWLQLLTVPSIKRVSYDTSSLQSWDSSLLTFLLEVHALSRETGILVDGTGLPPSAQRLLGLVLAVPERKGVRRRAAKPLFLDRVGGAALSSWSSSGETSAFIGESVIAAARLLAGKARFRSSDFFLAVEECGVRALPIVSLISLLVGLILAFISALQLRVFGAQAYVADLVGIGMTRALAAVMTGIIMAGRTGASFAAQLGTMQVNEEIDALKTLGLSPIEFLVLPRLLAMSLMMPLLSLWANVAGIAGGFLVGVAVLDLNPMEYYVRTREAVRPNDFWVGLFSAAVFGVLVSLGGCLRGVQCGRSASEVGEAATSAVVTSIVAIVLATAVITVLSNILRV